ncbi:MAG: hypothetical protein LUD52_05140 [Opitutae bacterium]|nr:hypothetical protein [Opitutae bacterium]
MQICSCHNNGSPHHQPVAPATNNGLVAATISAVFFIWRVAGGNVLIAR